MTQINHSQRAHALLSASSASRWLACTPSARLEEEFGAPENSEFAKEGTCAHELAELELRKNVLRNISVEEYTAKLAEIMANEYYNADMEAYVDDYVSYCNCTFVEALNKDPFALMALEQKLDLTEYIPEGFGTVDCCIVGNDVLEIIDFKYGKGVEVSPYKNKQLMIYALGALRLFDLEFTFDRIVLTIVQPRIGNIGSYEISVKELLDWANTELKGKAMLAYNGLGELVAGDHCRFCKIRNRCKALFEKQMEIAKYEFSEPEFLSDDDITDILKRAPTFSTWLNDILAYAQEEATTHNKHWPGFKLVEGRSVRAWADADNAGQNILERIPELSEDTIYEKKLLSLTAIERLIGKKRFSTELSDLVIKPQGKPTLVPESDKRPAIGSEQAIIDFSK